MNVILLCIPNEKTLTQSPKTFGAKSVAGPSDNESNRYNKSAK